MSYDKMARAVIQEIDEKVAQLQEHLGTGSAKDFSDYHSVCGEIKGLLFVRRYLIDLNKTMESSDE